MNQVSIGAMYVFFGVTSLAEDCIFTILQGNIWKGYYNACKVEAGLISVLFPLPNFL